MQQVSKDSHPSLYLLADHLDAALAMGEDLLASRVVLAAADAGDRQMQRIEARNRDLTAFLSTTRTHEMALVSRLLQARKWADELRQQTRRQTDFGLRPVIQLFLAGTAQLADVVAELGDTTNVSFETGNTAPSYLRSRGLLEADEVSLAGRSTFVVTDEFLVVGLARLGTLLDLVATFLDTLDLVGDLRIAEGAPMTMLSEAEMSSPLPN